MRVFEYFNQSRGGNHFLLRALALTMSAFMLAAAFSGCKEAPGNNPTETVKAGGSGQSASTEAPKQSENYHTIEVDGKTYYVLDKEYSGDYSLQEVVFLNDGTPSDYSSDTATFIGLTGQPIPEDFRQETVMDKAAYEAYCQKFGLTPAYPDHDGGYAVLACGSEWAGIVYVKVADAAVDGDKLRLYFWEDYHNPQPNGIGFVLTVPVSASVTKLEVIGMVSAEEAENLRKYGTTYDPENMVAEKPVIYLYPEAETQVQVKLDYEGQLTCTYPAYRAGWTVTAEPDGTLTDEKGMTYNYLYWEGEADTAWDFTKGFCVRGEDTAAFLEDALSKLGLTRREANEFIVYWLPRMEGNAWNLISFQGQNYTDSAKLTVSPAPDTVIRVFMAWKGLDAPVEIEPQTLTAPERTGFTVVEWGGSGK